MSYDPPLTRAQRRMIEESARVAGVPDETVAAAMEGSREALLDLTESIERYTDRLERAERLYLESLPPLERLGLELRWLLSRAWSRLRRR